MNVPLRRPPHLPRRVPLPALRHVCGVPLRAAAWAVVALSVLWAGEVVAAPQIPAHLDLAAGRIVVEAPISGQYMTMCQTEAWPQYAGPWALEQGETARFPLLHLGVPCWVQVSEGEPGGPLRIWRTSEWTLWRVWLPEVGNQGENQ